VPRRRAGEPDGNEVEGVSSSPASATGVDTPLVSLDDVRAAARGLAGVALRTPLVVFGTARKGGATVLLKAESLQPVGAFKIRGAYHAMASLSVEERARGVVTHSSGNHAQGVARAARLLGIRATIVMPSDAPSIKRARVQADGAEIVTVGPASGDREAMAERLVAERGLILVPPYDDDRIIAGQGTVGLEIAEDVPDLAAVLVPIGGGGLASGVVVAVKAMHPQARVVGVEPELAADAQESLRAGRVVRWQASRTGRWFGDGTRSLAFG
jgi:threonine dehydratase